MALGKGFTDRYLTSEIIRQGVCEGLSSLAIDGQRVLVIIPDGTRTMPMPLMFDFEAQLTPRVAASEISYTHGKLIDEIGYH